MRALPAYALVFLAFALVSRLDFIFYIVYLCIGIYTFARWFGPYSLSKLKVERASNRIAVHRLGDFAVPDCVVVDPKSTTIECFYRGQAHQVQRSRIPNIHIGSILPDNNVKRTLQKDK